MKKISLEKAVILKNNNKSFAIVSSLQKNNELVYDPEENNSYFFDNKTVKEINFLISNNISKVINFKNENFFINVFQTTSKVIIIGAVHISQPLSKFLTFMGYDVFIIEPRVGFADKEKFPNINIISEWPETALSNININDKTALITLTHDPKLDDPTLSFALNTNAFYIGALGSKKTHSARIKRLKELGFSDKLLNKISGPIGLDIKAKTPEEIAISIVAEIILYSNGQSIHEV